MDDASGTAEIVGEVVGGAVSAWMTQGIKKPSTAKPVSVMKRRDSVAEQVLTGIERAHPDGVSGMVEKIAADEDKAPRLLPILGQIIRQKEGEGSSDREFNLTITAGKAPQGGLTSEEMREKIAAMKEGLGKP